MPGRLITLDKQPIMRLVGVGETWRCIFSKIFLKVAGTEATMACQDVHMCSGIKVGIGGAVHRVQDIWYKNLTTEDWGFFLVDEKRNQRDQ